MDNTTLDEFLKTASFTDDEFLKWAAVSHPIFGTPKQVRDFKKTLCEDHPEDNDNNVLLCFHLEFKVWDRIVCSGFGIEPMPTCNE